MWNLLVHNTKKKMLQVCVYMILIYWFNYIYSFWFENFWWKYVTYKNVNCILNKHRPPMFTNLQHLHLIFEAVFSFYYFLFSIVLDGKGSFVSKRWYWETKRLSLDFSFKQHSLPIESCLRTDRFFQQQQKKNRLHLLYKTMITILLTFSPALFYTLKVYYETRTHKHPALIGITLRMVQSILVWYIDTR